MRINSMSYLTAAGQEPRARTVGKLDCEVTGNLVLLGDYILSEREIAELTHFLQKAQQYLVARRHTQ